MTTGKFLLSLDFELGWGVAELGYWREREAQGIYRDLREAMKRFLALLDSHHLTVIWATVGGMLAQRSGDEFDHLPDPLRTKFQTFANEAEDASIDARDLFETIVAAKMPHQIASHSYSHARFSYPGYTLAGKTEDLRKSREAMKMAGHDVDALVFPINHSTDFEPLAANGFRVGRVSPDESKFGNGPLNKLHYRTFAQPPMVKTSLNEHGVIEHSGSMLFMWPQGRLSDTRRKFVSLRARKGLAAAARTGGAFHMWLHPFDLIHTPGMEEDLFSFLRHVAKECEAGRIECGTL